MDIQTISLQFLVVLCKCVYNCLLGIPFAAALDVVVSPVYLKLKFHNLHGEPPTVNTNIEAAKMIYQAFHQDQIGSKAMETYVAYLIGQLRSMDIQPPRSS